MQRVKIDAAPVRLKNGICSQMVQIDQHGGKENQIHFFPVFPEKYNGNDKWKNQVQKIMQKRL